MISKIEELLKTVQEAAPKSAAEVEELRIRILGKKGELTAVLRGMGQKSVRRGRNNL